MNKAAKLAKKQIPKINFRELIKEAVTEDVFTKEETIAYLRTLVLPILKTGFTLTLNADAVEAIKEELKGNMALHIGSITLEQVLFPVTAMKRKKRWGTADYEKAISEIYSFMRYKNAPCSLLEIKEHLITENIELTSSRWLGLRNTYLKKTKWGDKFSLKLAEGTSKKSAKWVLTIFSKKSKNKGKSSKSLK